MDIPLGCLCGLPRVLNLSRLFNKLVGVAVSCQIVVNAGTFCFPCFRVIFCNTLNPVDKRPNDCFLCALWVVCSFVHRPRVWLRYVDDVFSIVKKTRVEELLKHLNNQYLSIQFTVEVGTENRLPFLDVTVHRVGNALELCQCSTDIG